MDKFNQLVGGSVLGHDPQESFLVDPVIVEMKMNRFDEYVMWERLQLEGIQEEIDFILSSPLPVTYHLDLEGALPYFILVVAFLLAVGGWFWWFYLA